MTERILYPDSVFFVCVTYIVDKYSFFNAVPLKIERL